MTTDLQILARCPDCARLSVDNPQHCPDKSPAAWAKSCRWKKCVGAVENVDGKKVRCGRVYGPDGWPGFRSGS